MTDSATPYVPPDCREPRRTHWEKIRDFFSGKHSSESQVFLGGEAFIVEGIAFFVDPADPENNYAASPAPTTSTQRVNLVVAETIDTKEAKQKRIAIRWLPSINQNRCP